MFEYKSIFGLKKTYVSNFSLHVLSVSSSIQFPLLPNRGLQELPGKFLKIKHT